MKNFFNKWIDRVVAVAGAFVFCQVPSFMVSYQKVLLGHLEESRHYVKLLQEHAALSGKTLEQYIGKFLAQSDPDFVNQGAMMQEVVLRNSAFDSAYRQLLEANIWSKPFVFIKELDLKLFDETYHTFSLTVVVNTETIVYALVGMVIAVTIYKAITKTIAALFKRKKKKV